MDPESHNDEGQYSPKEEDVQEFEELMMRWGIEFPQEAAKSLDIHALLEKWCATSFERPALAVEELIGGSRHAEAAAALFAYCYTALSPSLFKGTLSECLAFCKEEVEWLSRDDIEGLDEELRRGLLMSDQRRATICQDLLGFQTDYSSGRLVNPDLESSTSLSCYLDVMLTASYALISLSGENKQYDPFLREHLIRAFEIIRERKVLQAERFSRRNFNDEGAELTGEVTGFLACLGCAAVCYALALTESELRPEQDRDYETAFKAYVCGASHMCKTGYYINAFFRELLTEDVSSARADSDIYWRIIAAWEQVRKSIERVRDRSGLQRYLTDLEDIMWHEGNDMEFVQGDDPGCVYVARQIDFLKGRLSQEEMLELADQQKHDYQKKRLQIDFFGDLWWRLETKTRERLVSAECEWYDGFDRRSYVRSAIEHYSAALEIELRALVFSIDEVRFCVKGIIDKQRNDSSYRRSVRINSRTAESLNLKDISKLLKYALENRKDAEPIRKAIRALPVAEHEKALFSQGQFLEDLLHVYLLRNASTHTLESPDILLRTRDLRRSILGIGCEGYLPSLAAMKKQTGILEQGSQ